MKTSTQDQEMNALGTQGGNLVAVTRGTSPSTQSNTLRSDEQTATPQSPTLQNEKQETYTVYALAHPVNNTVHYVGMTKRLAKRYKEHLRRRQKGFIRSLQEEGLQPALLVLEENIETIQEARALEKYWITTYESHGHVLENLAENEDARYARLQEELYTQMLNEKFSGYPSDIAQELIRLTRIGHDVVGNPWDMMLDVVGDTAIVMAKRYGINKTLTQVDIMKLTLEVFGYVEEEGE